MNDHIFSEEFIRECFREEGWKEGYEEGWKESYEEERGKVRREVEHAMRDFGISEDVIARVLEQSNSEVADARNRISSCDCRK